MKQLLYEISHLYTNFSNSLMIIDILNDSFWQVKAVWKITHFFFSQSYWKATMEISHLLISGHVSKWQVTVRPRTDSYLSAYSLISSTL